MSQSTLRIDDDPGAVPPIKAVLFFKEALLKSGWASDVRMEFAGGALSRLFWSGPTFASPTPAGTEK
jgi:hypothetical protein